MNVQVALCVLLLQGAESQHARLEGKAENGNKIPFDLTVNDDGTATDPFYKQSVNFYDFNASIEARRFVEDDKCFIRPFHGDLEKAKYIAASGKGVSATEDVYIEAPGKEFADVAKTAGEKVAKFCSGYQAVWTTKPKKTTMNVKRGWWSRTRGRVGGSYGNGGWSVSGSISF